MRRTGDSRNPLGSVLDSVLGSEASVRIVRELSLADAPLGRAEIARRTGLTLPGVGYAVNRLHASGVVELVGSGARQSVQIRSRHPFARYLGMLFFVERGYGDAVLDRLRRALDGVSPPPRAAWLERGKGPAAPAVLTVLAGARDVSTTREQLRGALSEIQNDLDVAFELCLVTDADVETADRATLERWEHATPVHGVGPAGIAGPPPRSAGRRTHQERDAAALLRGVWIARRLGQDPTLIKRAREWLVTQIPTASAREEHELQEWLEILDGSAVPRIQHILSDPGERGTRLRQSNPFIHVLSGGERSEMRKETSR